MSRTTSLLVGIVVAFLVVGTAPAALAQQERAVWQPGPGGIGDNTYLGYIEQPPFGNVDSGAPFVISGWLVDKSAQGWAGFDQVQIYTGPMDAGGTQLAFATVGLDRPDVGDAFGKPSWNNSGFSAEVPGSVLQPGVSPVLVYCHT